MTHPPVIPTWMLKHFGCGPNNDVLLGDLAEQYRQRQNALWYWRQAMKAIPVSLFQEVRKHKRPSATALATGWGVWMVFIFGVLPFLTPSFLGASLGVSIAPTDPIGSAWSALWAPVLIQYGNARAFSFVFAMVLPLVVWTSCGWLVARLHREHQKPVVMLLAGSILLMNLLLVGPFVLRVGLPVALRFLAPLAACAALSVLGILAGGRLFTRTST